MLTAHADELHRHAIGRQKPKAHTYAILGQHTSSSRRIDGTQHPFTQNGLGIGRRGDRAGRAPDVIHPEELAILADEIQTQAAGLEFSRLRDQALTAP